MLQALGLPALLRLVGMGGARAVAAAAAPATATAVRAAAPALGSAAQAAAPTAGMGNKLNYLIGGATALGGLATIPYLFGAGQPSQEEQERMLKRQLEIQAEFEQGKGGGGGEMADPRLAGLLQEEPRGMTGLLMDEDFTRQMADVSKEMGKLQRTRPRGSSELEGIIAGNEAALAQIQNERVLSPMEIIQMLESMNG